MYDAIGYPTAKDVNLRTDLLAPRPEIELDSQTTEVTLSEVQLRDVTTPLWLPNHQNINQNWIKSTSPTMSRRERQSFTTGARMRFRSMGSSGLQSDPSPYGAELCDHDSLLFSTLIIVVIVFQLRVVAETPKSLSIALRKPIAFIWRR